MLCRERNLLSLFPFHFLNSLQLFMLFQTCSFLFLTCRHILTTERHYGIIFYSLKTLLFFFWGYKELIGFRDIGQCALVCSVFEVEQNLRRKKLNGSQKAVYAYFGSIALEIWVFSSVYLCPISPFRTAISELSRCLDSVAKSLDFKMSFSTFSRSFSAERLISSVFFSARATSWKMKEEIFYLRRTELIKARLLILMNQLRRIV